MRTSKTLLVTRPSHDPTTRYCYYWSEPVIKKAKEKAFRVLDIADNKATKEIFESYLQKQEPQFLFLNGHGTQIVVFGHDDKPILDESNVNVVPQGSIMYVRSCDVGDKLGEDIVQRASAFIGYRKAFGFYRLNNYMRNPLADSLAKFSFEPSNLVATTLLKGKTAEEAHERSREAMRRNLQYLLSSKASELERQCATPLWWNYKYQVLHGNKEARLQA
ncbi:hypothetical protein HY339_00945 [Candidatus Gottesmanbacteria bacterium]|nr:hypothetical protein [Candidatus Gottesmanbacteria bacterium]